MKKLMKVLCLVLVLVMLVAPVTSMANSFSEFADEKQDSKLVEDVKSIGSEVYTVLRAVGFIVAICMVVYMAIQWLLATPSKKAELKGRMFSMAIGVVLLVAGVAILGVVENAVENVQVVQDNQ